MIALKNCPVCGSNKIIVIERGIAERDSLTKEIWFVSETGYFCRCMNEECIHETPEATTYDAAVEIWNRGIIHEWEKPWYNRYHSHN